MQDIGGYLSMLMALIVLGDALLLCILLVVVLLAVRRTGR